MILLTNNFTKTPTANVELKFIEEIVNSNIAYHNHFKYYFKYLLNILKKSFVECVIFLNNKENNSNIYNIFKNIIFNFNYIFKPDDKCNESEKNTKQICDCLHKYDCYNKIDLDSNYIPKEYKKNFIFLFSELFSQNDNTKIINFIQNIKNENDKKNIIIYLFLYFLRLYYNSLYLIDVLHKKYVNIEVTHFPKYNKDIILLFFNVFDDVVNNKMSFIDNNKNISGNISNNIINLNNNNVLGDINTNAVNLNNNTISNNISTNAVNLNNNTISNNISNNVINSSIHVNVDNKYYNIHYLISNKLIKTVKNKISLEILVDEYKINNDTIIIEIPKYIKNDANLDNIFKINKSEINYLYFYSKIYNIVFEFSNIYDFLYLLTNNYFFSILLYELSELSDLNDRATLANIYNSSAANNNMPFNIMRNILVKSLIKKVIPSDATKYNSIDYCVKYGLWYSIKIRGSAELNKIFKNYLDDTIHNIKCVKNNIIYNIEYSSLTNIQGITIFYRLINYLYINKILCNNNIGIVNIYNIYNFALYDNNTGENCDMSKYNIEANEYLFPVKIVSIYDDLNKIYPIDIENSDDKKRKLSEIVNNKTTSKRNNKRKNVSNSDTESN